MATALYLAIFCLIVFAARMFFARTSVNLAVDQFYWLQIAEDVARHRLRPVAHLDTYLLEPSEQRYPPLFGWMISFVPRTLLIRHGKTFSQILDCVNAWLCGYVMLRLGAGLPLALAGAFLYGVNHQAYAYNFQLQPRVLGALLLNVFSLGVWKYLRTDAIEWLIAATLIWTTILFLHKMTLQLSLALTVVFAGVFRNWQILLIPPAGVLIGLIISRGFLLRQLVAHFDIVRFWHRNWRYLNAHQVYDSPLYGRPELAGKKYHQSGVRGTFLHAARLASRLPIVLPIVFLLFVRGLPSGGFEFFVFAYFVGVLAWAFLTELFVKSLGTGMLYLYNGVLPSVVFVLIGFMRIAGTNLRLWLIGLTALGTLVEILMSLRYFRKYVKGGDSATGEALSWLKGQAKAPVMVFPMTLADRVACETGFPVFWGGHGDRMCEQLDPYFPILKTPVPEIFDKFSIRYLLVEKGAVESLADIGVADRAVEKAFVNDKIMVYIVRNKADEPATD